MRKKETIIFNAFGFPIRLINVPMKNMFGEWVVDVNLNQLQTVVLHMLVKKPSRLAGTELRFIRSYLTMSTYEFAKLFGVSHVAVLKWENETNKMNPATEVYLRLYVLNHLKITAREFQKTFSKIKPEDLIGKEESLTLEIDGDREDLIAC